MHKNGSHLGWLAAGLAVSGLAMTPAIARVLNGKNEGVSLKALGSIGSFTVSGADPELAANFELKALRGNNNFKFTPVGGNRDGDRAVTVVVRQPDTNAVSVRENIALASPGAQQIVSTKITRTSYSLGSAKGLKSFALPVKQLKGNIPDLADLNVGQKRTENRDNGKKSRFNTRFSLDAKAPVNAAPRALDASEKDYTLDVGGSYSVTKNLAVTAGVRYNNERDRMAPLTDSRQDSQAVYVGTRFRF
jgi:opacity protein-like surface antigen